MKPKEYKVQILERSIHLEPKVRPTDEQLTRSEKPVRICKKAEAYEWANGKIDIMYKENPEPQRPPILRTLAEFPFCRIMHSKRRVNMIISFGKAEAEIVERQMIFDHDKWFEAIAAACQTTNENV